ncbi:hypothetical protein A2Z22_03260 [Candidatus Woesebacteria bacterium RBG_16_34_12]|uniref:Aminoglycoside phosphotransferase domain-containing protein n=1 Tax=Candidatus Woesebacteria bacterium RBG_16_34_12 TaxID=1802480 RepID=A0A1F7XAP2_9BACT|nr:MAG: hypothetical protein A2Z22_03260 [Candidatus Woesebacteria bacterium RBG_16_34_12]
MSDLLKSKGIFSGESLPDGWRTQKINFDHYLKAMEEICPGWHAVGTISKGANNITFVLNNLEGLRVCQFSVFSREEDSSLDSFETISGRLSHLQKCGVAVPYIITGGELYVDEKKRRYIVMDFVRGVSADNFLSRHPKKKQDVHFEFGKVLGQLRATPILNSRRISANEHLLHKVDHISNLLVQSQVFSMEQMNRLTRSLKDRLLLLGDAPFSYVHLDPFPINFRITGTVSNFDVTLMDVDAIQEGHPLVEGLGRAIKWGIYDWSYVNGETTKDTTETVNAFLEGYSQSSSDPDRFMRSVEKTNLLLETAEMVGLPETILRESKKERPQEYYEWSKNRLLELSEK